MANETFREFMENRGFMDEDLDMTLYSQFMNAFHQQFGGLPGAFQSHSAKVALRRGRTRHRNRRVRDRHEGAGRAPAEESGDARARDSGWDVLPSASDTDTDAFAHGQWSHALWAGPTLLPPVDQVARSPSPAVWYARAAAAEG